MVKGFPAGLHVPTRAIKSYYLSYNMLSWFALIFVDGEVAWGKVLARYLPSAGLSPSRTHFIASLKMSGMTITYSGYCHPLSPDNSNTNSSPKSPLGAYPLQKGSKFFKIFLWKYSIQEGYGVIFSKKMKIKRSTRDPNPKIVQKRSSIKWPTNVSKSVSPFLPLLWTFMIP